jgi:rhodanese-related sulfurtransferase
VPLPPQPWIGKSRAASLLAMDVKTLQAGRAPLLPAQLKTCRALSSMLIEMLDYEITVAELAERRKNAAALVLLDVREPWEQEEALIEGSRLMPMADVPSRAHQELDPDSDIIAICHHGTRSMSVTMWLRDQGFEKVQSLRGGIDAWSREVDPKVPRY